MKLHSSNCQQVGASSFFGMRLRTHSIVERYSVEHWIFDCRCLKYIKKLYVLVDSFIFNWWAFLNGSWFAWLCSVWKSATHTHKLVKRKYEVRTSRTSGNKRAAAAKEAPPIIEHSSTTDRPNNWKLIVDIVGLRQFPWLSLEAPLWWGARPDLSILMYV